MDKMKISVRPIRQSISGQDGVYLLTNQEKFKRSMAQYHKYSMRHPAPAHKTCKELERIFWEDPAKTLKFSLYGTDVDASLFNNNDKTWNMNKLSTILDDIGYTIKGITSPYLFVGSWGTAFAIHNEDMDLYSVSYLHHGAPKTHYLTKKKKRFS